MQGVSHLQQHRSQILSESFRKKALVVALGFAGFACITLLIILGQGM